MRKTLQHRVEKAGVAHIGHSISHPLLTLFHQRVDFSFISHLFKLTSEIFLIFLPLLPFLFELFSTLRSNATTSLRLLIKLLEPKEAGTIVIWFKHRVVIIATPMLLPIVMVSIFVLTHI